MRTACNGPERPAKESKKKNSIRSGASSSPKLSLAVAQRSLGAPVIRDEACHPKCRRGMIGRHGEQQLVDFAGKVGAITRRGNQTEPGIDADGHDNAASRPHAIADASAIG
jgi:hypothetical protein